jgi:hypothetical protein
MTKNRCTVDDVHIRWHHFFLTGELPWPLRLGPQPKGILHQKDFCLDLFPLYDGEEPSQCDFTPSMSDDEKEVNEVNEHKEDSRPEMHITARYNRFVGSLGTARADFNRITNDPALADQACELAAQFAQKLNALVPANVRSSSHGIVHNPRGVGHKPGKPTNARYLDRAALIAKKQQQKSYKKTKSSNPLSQGPGLLPGVFIPRLGNKRKATRGNAKGFPIHSFPCNRCCSSEQENKNGPLEYHCIEPQPRPLKQGASS